MSHKMLKTINGKFWADLGPFKSIAVQNTKQLLDMKGPSLLRTILNKRIFLIKNFVTI